jgi:hypothetical protein
LRNSDIDLIESRAKFNRKARSQRIKREQGERARQLVKTRKPFIPVSIGGYITIEQAAIKYNRASSGLYSAIRKGKLKSGKIGINRVIAISELEQYFSDARQNQKDGLYRAMCSRVKSS